MIKGLMAISIILTALTANGLTIEENLGRGGVNLAIGGEANALFSNPAGIPFTTAKVLEVNFMDSSLALSSDSMSFVKALNSASKSSRDKNKNISELLNKNIGKPLHLSANNFSSISQSEASFSWVVGVLSALDASFITHTGFGSLGAMESQVDEYHALVGAIAKEENNFRYGLSIKAINRYQIAHNYSITEMLEADSIGYYFDNEYKEKKFSMSVDAGLIYHMNENPYDLKIAFSLLNIGDTNFDALGRINETSNVGIAVKPYKNMLVAIDYMDMFDQSNESYVADNLRIGVANKFFKNSLELSSGIYNQSLTLGVKYQLKYFNIGINTYKTKGYNNKKFREYQLSLAFNW
ncbi:MAG: Unknown protein [uncultured Sulfurovum sp.]|uniref:Uncharacterized protein n=1 Tax=uncultured Sulfurovum sp. TaxID=269237 RepID=A0A6S6TIE8_9BACT|nr:MAG: Unknown protein [uncultured Sulfurovum sp.]